MEDDSNFLLLSAKHCLQSTLVATATMAQIDKVWFKKSRHPSECLCFVIPAHPIACRAGALRH